MPLLGALSGEGGAEHFAFLDLAKPMWVSGARLRSGSLVLGLEAAGLGREGYGVLWGWMGKLRLSVRQDLASESGVEFSVV